MAKTISSRFRDAWNVFRNRTSEEEVNLNFSEPESSYRPDRTRRFILGERTIIASIYNRIAMDVSDINIKHVRLDNNGRYLETIRSGLNDCFNLEANIDQTGRDFMRDAVISMLEEGVVALVPVDTNVNPKNTDSFDVLSMRTGKVTGWFPSKVRVDVYNELVGKKQEVILEKRKVALVENPLYYVMNGDNSTLRRLIRKLNILDAIDDQVNSSKLDLIIQLPYVIKTEGRQKEAEKRKKQIEDQLYNSKYGIAYIDGTEKITQLNRSLDNNLMNQIEYLTTLLYSQLGLAKEVFEGTADSTQMNNYLSRTIKPIASAFSEELKRKFLTKTARTQGQSVEFFNDPFKFIPTDQIAEMADKFTRNEIMTANEFRQAIGLQAADDPNADELRNKNINASPIGGEAFTPEEAYDADQELADLDDQLVDLESMLQSSIGGEELIHYASPYYDPVKAHEYYMKNRELKGRKSTAGLTDKGKEAASYVKDRINEERKAKISESRASTKSDIKM